MSTATISSKDSQSLVTPAITTTDTQPTAASPASAPSTNTDPVPPPVAINAPIPTPVKKSFTKPRPLNRVPPSPLRSSTTFSAMLSPNPHAQTFGQGAQNLLLSPNPSMTVFNPLSPRFVPGGGPNGLLSPRVWGNENSEALDQWFQHFEQFDATLNDMAAASADLKFKEELNTIENWFLILSEAERTATIYTLLQHSNPNQVRFFIAVLQQMQQAIRPDSARPASDPSKPKAVNSTNRPSLSVPSTPRTPNPPSSAPAVIKEEVVPTSDEGAAVANKAPPTPGIVVEEATQEATQEIEVKPPRTAGLGVSSDWASMVSTPLSPMFKAQQRKSNPHTLNSNLNPNLGYSPLGGMISPQALQLQQMQMQLQMQQIANAAAMGGMGMASPGMMNMNMNDAQMLAMQMMIAQQQQQQLQQQILFAAASQPTSPNPPHSARSARDNKGQQNGAAANGANKSGATPGAANTATSWRSPSSSTTTKFSGGVKLATSSRKPSSTINRSTSSPSTANGASAASGGNQDFNPDALKDIPTWLKSLRLHKYTPCFGGLSWQQLIILSEEDLEKRGVAALGARRRLLKTFEVARKEMNMETDEDRERRKKEEEEAAATA